MNNRYREQDIPPSIPDLNLMNMGSVIFTPFPKTNNKPADNLRLKLSLNNYKDPLKKLGLV